MTRLGVQVVVLLFLVSTTALNGPVLFSQTAVAAPIVSAQNGAYQSHSSIIINGNDGLVSQEWNGTGTAEDPFIIEDLNITASWGSCILVYGTSLHLVIRNCALYSAGSDAVVLNNVSNCTIESCIVVEVSVSQCNNCSIKSNDFQGYGLELSSSRNISVTHNKMGSPLWLSGDSEEDWRHTIANNTVNGKPIGFIHDKNNLVINPDSYGSLILLNCSHVNITDGSLNSGHAIIQLGFCRHSSVVHNVGYAIYCSQSLNLHIHHNIMAANVTMGIALFDSNNTLIESNSIYANRLNGIGIFDSDNCTVRANAVTGEMGHFHYGQDGYVTYDGIALRSSANCLVEENTLDMNPSSGIYALYCPALRLNGNHITNNQRYGIEVFYGYGTISRNIIHSNNNSGIELDGYRDSVVESNDIRNNTVGITAGYGCSNVTVSNNEIHDLSTDIILRESTSLCIKGNILYGYGLFIDPSTRHYALLSYWQHTIENNTLNGGPIGYLWGQNGGSVSIHDNGFTQLIIANSTGLHVYDGQFSHSSFLIAFSSSLNVENMGFDSSQLGMANSESCTTQDCVFLAQSAFMISQSNDCHVQNCIFNQSPLQLYGSEAIQIESNVFQHHGADILFSESSHCIVSDNEFLSSGVSFYGYQIEDWTHDFINNTVNGRPLGYFKEVSQRDINASEYGALVLADCHSLNVTGADFQDTRTGIQMGLCTDCIVSNIVCIGSYEYGVVFVVSPNCTLKNSIVAESMCGVRVGSSYPLTDDVTLSNCTVTNNTYGISLTLANSAIIVESTISNNEQDGISLYYSSDAYIENNTICMNGGSGIARYDVADNCTILGNNITANSQDGIQYLDSGSVADGNYIVGNGGYGLSVLGSNSLIYHNWIVTNNNTGIEVSHSSNLTISSNVICNNTVHGLHIEGSSTSIGSSNNTIYDNLIGWNEAGNALDDGLSNMWDNGTRGNAWSDYDGSGFYPIAGAAGSIDHFPRLLKVFPITSGGNTTGQTEDEFQWLLLVCSLLISAEVAIAVLIAWRNRESALAHTFDT